MPNVIIVIPTYWTWSSQQPDGPVEAVYDHPTPMDGESTLPRLLESLSAPGGPEFGVLILTAVTHPELETAAAGRVTSLIAPFRAQHPIAQATEADAAAIRRRRPSLAAHVQMRNYAGVRNLQLLLAHALGAEVIVALDDDETVAPDVMLPEGPRTDNVFLDKNAIMNEGTRALQATPGRLAPTPVALGGNMIFHRDLFTQVGFDPGITRGEDIDYLINARLAGHRFWLDKELLITHRPPEAYGALPTPNWRRMSTVSSTSGKSCGWPAWTRRSSTHTPVASCTTTWKPTRWRPCRPRPRRRRWRALALPDR